MTIATSAALAAPVGAHVWPLTQCDIGTHEDQIATLAFDHAGKHRTGHPVGADQVDLDLRLELLGADGVQLAEVRIARAGDKHLDLAELGCRLLDTGLDRVGVGDVEVHRDGFTAVGADLVDQLLALLHPARPQRHRKKTMGGKVYGRRGADPGGGAGHQRRSAVG